MKAAELIVKCLENEGVEYIFGVPGEENMDLLDALLSSSSRQRGMAGPVPLRGSRHLVPRAWYVFQSYSAGDEESNRELAAAAGE